MLSVNKEAAVCWRRNYFILLDVKCAHGEQECISVGCVPPVRYRTGVSLIETPPTETPLDRDSPWTETPWTETPTDRTHPPPHPDCTQTPSTVSRITDRCKTLPCRKFLTKRAYSRITIALPLTSTLSPYRKRTRFRLVGK